MIMTTREIYRLEANGEVLCTVAAEVPQWIPAVEIPPVWVRNLVRLAINAWRTRRS